MMEDEIKELIEKMNEAIEKNDGWLAHYYGSQLQFRTNLREELKRKSEIYKQKIELLKEECESRAEEKYWNWVFRKKEPWFKLTIG